MMSAIAVFTCVSGSHPFQERRITLSDPAKIGRSVAQARPNSTNTIFDCKVLSRNHALLWYEGAKFFLQDTKSSNGTFVNSRRLSKGSEESSPMEIFSGDTIQFGVDVMENSLTHNCIIATVQLYHPNGQEAKTSALSDEIVSHGLKSQELFQLAQCIQEATHREMALETKLVALQRLLQTTQESTERGWQALVDEDRLLSRLECLEDQLSVFAKGHSDDTLRIQVVSLIEDKANYEIAAKESLRRLLEEKLEAARRVTDLERSLNDMENELLQQQGSCQVLQNELQLLAEKWEQQSQDLAEANDKLQDATKRLEDEHELKVENQMLHTRLEEMIAHVESLQAENDFVNEQMTNIKAKLESMKTSDSIKISNGGVSRGIQTDLINLIDLRRLHENASPEKSDNDDDDNEDRNDKVDSGRENIEKELEETPFITLVGTQTPEIEKLHSADVEKTSQAKKILLLEDELGNSALEMASQTARLQYLEAHVRVLQQQLDQERQLAVRLHGSESCPATADNISQMQ